MAVVAAAAQAVGGLAVGAVVLESKAGPVRDAAGNVFGVMISVTGSALVALFGLHSCSEAS